MFDPEFESFYKNVKDPSWPDISEYREFIELSPAIKNECRNMHGLDRRLDQICDPNNWISSAVETGDDLWICCHKNIAFVPVPKCAYTYYLTKLTDLGWTMMRIKDVDLASTQLFGLLMHPLNRYLKGITELLVRSYSEPEPKDAAPWTQLTDTNWGDLFRAMDSPYFLQLISKISVGDHHSMPYHAMFGDLMPKIYWIPIELFDDDQLKQQVIEFGLKNRYEISLPQHDQRLHQSSPQQLQIYNLIKTLFFNSNGIYRFYKIFGSDLRFYYRLLDKFSH